MNEQNLKNSEFLKNLTKTIHKDNLVAITATIFNKMEYCFNLCNTKSDLKDYKKCVNTCESFQNKKFVYVNNYLEQLEDFIEGRINNNNLKKSNELTENTNKSSPLVDKYVYKDFYYQSNASNENLRQEAGSVFGRNK